MSPGKRGGQGIDATRAQPGGLCMRRAACHARTSSVRPLQTPPRGATPSPGRGPARCLCGAASEPRARRGQVGGPAGAGAIRGAAPGFTVHMHQTLCGSLCHPQQRPVIQCQQSYMARSATSTALPFTSLARACKQRSRRRGPAAGTPGWRRRRRRRAARRAARCWWVAGRLALRAVRGYEPPRGKAWGGRGRGAIESQGGSARTLLRAPPPRELQGVRPSSLAPHLQL